MITILSEDIYQSIIVSLTPGQVDGCGIEILLEERLKFSFSVIFVQTNHLKPFNEVFLAGMTQVATYPAILQENIERSPLTKDIDHTAIECSLVG